MEKFKTEDQMHKNIYSFFSEKLNCSDVIIESEVQGLFGIPDIVLSEKRDGMMNHVIAVELKLYSWQKALKQAFKYQSFAWESYVILDDKRLGPALVNVELFKKYNIGLGAYSVDGSFRIIYRPTIRKPYSQNIFNKLCSYSCAGKVDGTKANSNPNRKSGLGKAFQCLGNISA